MPTGVSASKESLRSARRTVRTGIPWATPGKTYFGLQLRARPDCRADPGRPGQYELGVRPVESARVDSGSPPGYSIVHERKPVAPRRHRWLAGPQTAVDAHPHRVGGPARLRSEPLRSCALKTAASALARGATVRAGSERRPPKASGALLPFGGPRSLEWVRVRPRSRWQRRPSALFKEEYRAALGGRGSSRDLAERPGVRAADRERIKVPRQRLKRSVGGRNQRRANHTASDRAAFPRSVSSFLGRAMESGAPSIVGA